jgi:hypothetical protein
MVITLTVLTAVAFSVFFFKLVGKVTSSPKETPWAMELRTVGDKLKEAGLHRQAIAQYTKYLDREGIDLKTRALVSQTLGELYKTLGDCGEALVWFYRAEAAGPDPADKNTLESQIATCLKEVKSGRP